jgi:hypothetical protein
MLPENNNKEVDFIIMPNPAIFSAEINYMLVEKNIVSLTLTDMYGQLIKTFIKNTPQEIGIHKYDLNTSLLSYGVYYCTLKIGNVQSIKKLMVLK